MYSTYYLSYIFFTKILVKERLHNEKRRKIKKNASRVRTKTLIVLKAEL